MRVNVYAEDLSPLVELVEKVGSDIVYYGVRFYIVYDRTVDHAVTFWGESRDDLVRLLQIGLDAIGASPVRMAEVAKTHAPFTGHPEQPPIGEFDSGYKDAE